MRPTGPRPRVTVSHHTEARCLADRHVLRVGRAIAALTRTCVAELELHCGNGSCVDREPSLSDKLTRVGAQYSWHRPSGDDPFQLLDFLPPDCSWERPDCYWD